MEPPIPRKAMMHFFKTPAKAGTTAKHLSILPKRHEYLEFGTERLKIGCGLNYKEEVSWSMIAVILGLIGLFALCWFIFNRGNDFKDAAPPAALAMAYAVIALIVIKEIAEQNAS